MDQIHLWPMIDQLPSCRIHHSPPAISVRFAREWSIHLPATAASVAYLRRLAAVVATCADVVDEDVTRRRSGTHKKTNDRRTEP
ncbi:hypothetical protein [Flindersiella endophytica]